MRLIDKDALLKELGISDEECEKCDRGDRNGYCAMSSDWTYACDAICTAPTIEERKTGKWIIEPYDAQNDIFIHRCGTCMRVAMLGGHTTKFKYCPICGSAMEGEQNGA